MDCNIPAAPAAQRGGPLIRRFDTRSRRLAGLSAVALLAGAGACVESPPALSLTAVQDVSPAGGDSTEPFLSSLGGTVYMSWLGRSTEGVRRLLFSRLVAGSWEESRVIAEREAMLVNVADVPSIVATSDGTLWSHWLERDQEGYGYGVRITHSEDGGATWAPPWTPHQDGTPTEHGFVTTVPLDGRVGFLWLDGRSFAATGASEARAETGLFFRSTDRDGLAGPETPIDPRVCDCCQTDVAVTSDGPVVVYRDRSPREIRDIRVTRLVDDEWIDGGLVRDDGWETGACPINGPAVSARGDQVAVAWYTAADGEGRVQVAFSDDGARSFRAPSRIDDGAPAGRVDVTLLEDGTAAVVWIERTGAAGAEVRLRRIGERGRRLESLAVSPPGSARAIGFPRLAWAGDRAIIVAWTDGTELIPRVRVTRIEMEES